MIVDTSVKLWHIYTVQLNRQSRDETLLGCDFWINVFKPLMNIGSLEELENYNQKRGFWVKSLTWAILLILKLNSIGRIKKHVTNECWTNESNDLVISPTYF